MPARTAPCTATGCAVTTTTTQDLPAAVLPDHGAAGAALREASCIVGWQIDNELNCETDEFYSKAIPWPSGSSFRRNMAPEELNKAWGTLFWNQTLQSPGSRCGRAPARHL